MNRTIYIDISYATIDVRLKYAILEIHVIDNEYHY